MIDYIWDKTDSWNQDLWDKFRGPFKHLRWREVLTPEDTKLVRSVLQAERPDWKERGDAGRVLMELVRDNPYLLDTLLFELDRIDAERGIGSVACRLRAHRFSAER